MKKINEYFKQIKYNIIFIDADGTLFDFKLAEKESLIKMLNNIENINKIKIDKNKFIEYYNEINKKVWEDLEKGLITIEKLKKKRFEEAFKNLKIYFDPLKANNLYLKYLSNSAILYNDSKIFLNWLYKIKKTQKFIYTILLTNGLEKVQIPRFNKTEMEKYFDCIVISEKVKATKPDRKIFEVAIKELRNKIINNIETYKNKRYNRSNEISEYNNEYNNKDEKDNNYNDRNGNDNNDKINKLFSKEKMIIIGDSLTSDIKGGINFGIKTCLLDRDGEFTDFFIKNNVFNKGNNFKKNYNFNNKNYNFDDIKLEVKPDFVCNNLIEVKEILTD